MALACLWIHGTTLDGKFERSEGHDRYGIKRNIEVRPADTRSLFEEHPYDPQDPVASANDQAVQTLIRGDSAGALAMLEDIEERYPGEYYTAANRGTALELAGRDEEALKWILEGIRRNPDSHMKTEWLHSRILEAKIQMKAHPDWLKSHTITGIDLAQLDQPDLTLPTAQGPKSRLEVYDALKRQLSVRVLFVKPKDPIVAQLLVELAYLESRERLIEPALEYIELAASYGADDAIVKSFQAEMQKGLSKWWMHPVNYRRWIGRDEVLLVACFAVLIGMAFYRLVWKRRKSVPQQPAESMTLI